MEEEKKQEGLDMRNSELVEYIKAKGIEMKNSLEQAKTEHPEKYNYNNRYERMMREFGDPVKEPEKFAAATPSILMKTSKLPATVRYAVRDICVAAFNAYFNHKQALRYKRDREKAEAAKKASEGEPQSTGHVDYVERANEEDEIIM